MVDHILILTLYFNVAQATLYDIRDSKPYTVRKLADGNCWMTSNLALALSAGTPVLASSNTSGETYSFTPTSCETNGACAMNGNTVVYGGYYYYSWYAAVAESGNASTITDTAKSICPANWRLPADYSINTGQSYGSILMKYLGKVEYETIGYLSILENIPLSFVRLHGYFDNGSLQSVSRGYYWASTAMAENSRVAYGFAYDASNTWGGYGTYKQYGFAVRCVAQQ